MRMYTLIKARIASKQELESCYTLDEALKLYALFRMDMDIQTAETEEMKRESNRH